MSFSYPNAEQFGEAALEVAARLRGDTSVDGKKAVWVVMGYGLSLAQSQPAMMAGAESAACPQEPEAQAVVFENAAKSAQPAAARGGRTDAAPERVGAVPWAMLFALARQLLEQWLQSP